MAKKRSSATPLHPKHADGALLQLDATLEIGQVTEARGRLLGLIEAAPAATVDVSRIVSIDSAGVQLLVALRLEAEQRGTALDFRGESAALTRALKLLGLQGALSPPGTHAQ